jgi:hypothetical protein
MGLKDAMINLVGDFVQMNRNPEFRSKNELNKAGTSGGSGNLGIPNGAERRHSLSITVGAEGPPETFVRNRTYSVCGGEHISSPLPKSSTSSHKKNRRSSAPCILKEPPTFQLRRNRKTSESNDTQTSDITSSTPSSDRPRKPIIKKQKSEDFPERASDSSDDSENSAGDFQGRRMKQQNSPRFENSGFFKGGSFRGENIIEEEPEDGGQSPCVKPNNVTIITTRF